MKKKKKKVRSEESLIQKFFVSLGLLLSSAIFRRRRKSKKFVGPRALASPLQISSTASQGITFYVVHTSRPPEPKKKA